ncbi:hypothetical protein B0H13DRAFT_1587221, partial [Mycena leptocephala]
VENYPRDSKEALRLIRNHAGCPPFTETGWRCLLEGNYVDLDHVSRELFGHGIASLGDWITVWMAFQRAVNFAKITKELVIRGILEVNGTNFFQPAPPPPLCTKFYSRHPLDT